MPDPFLAILTHSPSEVACRSSRKASHASREAKGKIGRSGLAAMASPSHARCRRATKRRSVSSERPIPSLAVGPERPCLQFTRLFADSQVASAPFGHGREGTSGFLRGWSSTRHGCRLRAEHTPTTRGRHTLESERGSGAAGLELRGGCQCGSVRYRALVEDDEAYYCHCRMCQKAFGNLFGAFFFALEDTVEWEAGSLAYYRSSKIARRGFCRECGTPLSFEDAESGEIHLTVGSLDEPERLRPVAHYGFEGHVGPFFTDDGLPRSSTEDDEGYVERWKAAHGRDSMPGPLDGPIARPSPEGSCTIQHAKWHSVQIPSAHIGSGEGPRGSDRPGNARPPRLHLPWEAHRVVRNRIFWKKENKMQVTDARGLITYDVVVVGGGVAGLGGALILGRSRRSVLVIDAGEPRNAPAAGVHGFLTRDGMAPAALLEAGREEVRGYGAEVLDGRVASAESVDGGFTVMLEDGRRVGARRLLVATGLVTTCRTFRGSGSAGGATCCIALTATGGRSGIGRSVSCHRDPWPCIRRYCSGS